MDKWLANINEVSDWCPQAKNVFDLNHDINEYNKVIDPNRHDEYRQATQEVKAVLQGSMYLHLNNPNRLTGIERHHMTAL